MKRKNLFIALAAMLALGPVSATTRIWDGGLAVIIR